MGMKIQNYALKIAGKISKRISSAAARQLGGGTRAIALSGDVTGAVAGLLLTRRRRLGDFCLQ